jgi:hypothetical protein
MSGLTLAAVLVWSAAVLRNSGQIVAMSIYSKAHTQAQVARAALFDPGNARIRSRLDAMRNRGHAVSGAAAPAAPAPADTTDDTPEQPDTGKL